MLSQLSAQDAQFLYVQRGDVLTHVMSIAIYDPATARGHTVRFKDIVQHVDVRSHADPVFRRRLYRLPFNVDHPYWAKDPDFYVAKHITQVRLSRPGNWRQFRLLVARHFARPMDMNRPLWDILVVTGLDGMCGVAHGSYALLQRFHHAAIDGASGSHAMLALCDRDAEGTPAMSLADQDSRLGDVPTGATIAARAVTATLASPVRILNAALRLSPALLAAAQRARAEPAARTHSVPRTRFNERVSPHRTFAAVAMTLLELGAMRRLVADATINDVILAICSGALRRYLAAHDELPHATLVAVVPINARGNNRTDAAAGNDISAMTVELATHVADPVQRLRAIRRATSVAKLGKSSLGARVLTDLSRHLPGATLASVARLVSDERIVRSQANLIITNVPGPQFTLYMNGAQLTHQFGMGPLAHGLGLFIAAMSYDGVVSLSVTADRKLVPDVDFFSRCIDESFEELRRTRATARRKRSPARATRRPKS